MTAKRAARFKAGDRVHCKRGPAKGELGTVVERPLPGGGKSVHPRPGFVFVLFDRAAGVSLDAAIDALELVSDPALSIPKKPAARSIRRRPQAMRSA
jgi:hypothetical protein